MKLMFALLTIVTFSFLNAGNVKVEKDFITTVEQAYSHKSLKKLSKKIEGKNAYGLKFTNFTVNNLNKYGSINEEDSGLISLSTDTEINSGYGYQCVGLVKAVGVNFNISTTKWKKGRNITKRKPKKGYVIATFNSKDKYDYGHVAIVLKVYSDHIIVIDQNWDGTGTNPIGQIYIHSIDFKGKGINNANNYYIVRYP